MRDDRQHQLTPDLPPPVEAPELWRDLEVRPKRPKKESPSDPEQGSDPEHGPGEDRATGEPPD